MLPSTYVPIVSAVCLRFSLFRCRHSSRRFIAKHLPAHFDFQESAAACRIIDWINESRQRTRDKSPIQRTAYVAHVNSKFNNNILLTILLLCCVDRPLPPSSLRTTYDSLIESQLIRTHSFFPISSAYQWAGCIVVGALTLLAYVPRYPYEHRFCAPNEYQVHTHTGTKCIIAWCANVWMFCKQKICEAKRRANGQ